MVSSTASQRSEEEYIEINTRYGKQVVARSSLLTFPHGLPGFEDLHEFKLFHEEDGSATVYHLQSTEDPEICLPVVTPAACRVDYNVELTEEEARELQAGPSDELIVVVTLSDNADRPDVGITANFMAPIIINPNRRIGIQKTLSHVSGGVVIQAR
jgi:flagellar assembly factor FliW